jgi:predicted porin
VKYLFVCLIFVGMISGAAKAEDEPNLLFIQPMVSYRTPKIFTQGQAANYGGLSYGGSVYYFMGDSGFGIAPFVSYTVGGYDSSANTAVRTERLTDKVATVGLKVYFDSLFVRLGYQWITLKNVTQGTLNTTINASVNGFNGGIGYAIGLSRYVKLEISGDIGSADIPANNSGFTTNAQYLNLGASVGLGIVIPSSPRKKSYFKSKVSPDSAP